MVVDKPYLTANPTSLPEKDYSISSTKSIALLQEKTPRLFIHTCQ
jgi:hypothetical protein